MHSNFSSIKDVLVPHARFDVAAVSNNWGSDQLLLSGMTMVFRGRTLVFCCKNVGQIAIPRSNCNEAVNSLWNSVPQENGMLTGTAVEVFGQVGTVTASPLVFISWDKKSASPLEARHTIFGSPVSCSYR